MRQNPNQWSIRIRLWPTTLAIAALSAVTAHAQQLGEVTLRFADGQDSISGALINFEDNRFTIDSNIGLIVIPADGVACIGDACPPGTQLQTENKTVELSSKDGSVTFVGDVIEVTDSHYVIATSIGEQRVPIDLVTCKGDGCITDGTTPEIIQGGEVVLSNEAITLSGELIGFEDGHYLLQEATMGEIRVNADAFACEGAGCPEIE